MFSIKAFFSLNPLTTPGASAAAYVPWVMASRALAFLRTLLIAALLGKAGQLAFGLYQPALELINPLVALVMFGAADVAERYVAHIENQQGHAGLRPWLKQQWIRIATFGGILLLLLAALSPWLSRGIWGQRQIRLLLTCGIIVIALALYQHLSAVLRGLRAYSAAAGMELLGAILLLFLSAIAALFRDAGTLLIAYGISILVPLAIFATLLWKFLAAAPATSPQPAPTPIHPPSMTRFAAWSLVRLLLVMLFGFLAVWGVRLLGDVMSETKTISGGTLETAWYAMPYRIAQLLGFLAVTTWASAYGVMAKTWSNGQITRARVQMFRVGKLGLAALTLIAVALLLFRGIFEFLLPSYAMPIDDLLPGMLALFIAYGLVAFFSAYADLRETPQRGAALWGTAVTIQIAGLVAGAWIKFPLDPKQYVLIISTIALAAPLVLLVPPLLCRPIRFSATGVPFVILGAAAITLFCPGWVVDWIAAPVMLGAVVFLYVSGLLIRPMDKRSFRRWKKARAESRLTPPPPAQSPPPAPEYHADSPPRSPPTPPVSPAPPT